MSRLLTGLMLSAIMLCVGCEKQQASAGTGKSRENAEWRAATPGPSGADVDVYEVVVDGEHYLVASGFRCVSIVPKTKQPQVAERVQ